MASQFSSDASYLIFVIRPPDKNHVTSDINLNKHIYKYLQIFSFAIGNLNLEYFRCIFTLIKFVTFKVPIIVDLLGHRFA
jgi:hypothetical protein